MRIQELLWQMGEVNMTFKELVHRIVEQIKNKPYFRWPSKMGVIRLEEIRICTAPITKTKGTPLSSAEC